MRSKILRFVLPLFVIGFAFVIASYLKWTKPSVEPKPLTERAWTVSVPRPQNVGGQHRLD